MDRKYPKGIGNDFAGIVEAVGADVQNIQAGDEVFGTMDVKWQSPISYKNNFLVVYKESLSGSTTASLEEMRTTLKKEIEEEKLQNALNFYYCNLMIRFTKKLLSSSL